MDKKGGLKTYAQEGEQKNGHERKKGRVILYKINCLPVVGRCLRKQLRSLRIFVSARKTIKRKVKLGRENDNT